MNEYSTLARVRDYLTSSNVTMGTDDDPKLFRYLTWASRRIDRHCRGRVFYPRIETRWFDYQESRRLILDNDLLEVTTLTAGSTTISSDDYFLYPLSDYPKWKIEIDSSKSAMFDYGSTPQSAVSLDGIWGWHDDWDNAWPDSQDTVQDDPLTAAAATVTVSDVNGADVDGITPRISAGNLLKIDDEYLAVTATDTTANTATVRRGVNGTTAAAHDSGTAVYTFRPADVVTGCAWELVKYIYELRSSVGGVIALPSLEGGAVRVEIMRILTGHELPVRLTSQTRRG